MKDIAIIGAGLTGLMLSLFLARRGYQIDIYEQRPDPKQGDYLYGKERAISLDLSARGLLALADIGLKDRVLVNSVPMRNRILHLPSGELLSLPYGKSREDFIFTVSRSQLYKTLLETIAIESRIAIHFNQAFIDYDDALGEVRMLDQAANRHYIISPFFVFGCDGLHSAVRKRIEREGAIPFNQLKFPYYFKQLTIAATEHPALEFEAMHMWPREYGMLVAQPNHDHTFTCALMLPEKGQYSFEEIINRKSSQEILSWFNQQFFDACHLFGNFENEMLNNPVGKLLTINEGQWSFNGKLGLMGDSAHAMVPFFGQGLNCCFEDCYLFNKMLDQFQDDWQLAILAFEELRKKDTNAITIMSYENYPELIEPDLRQSILQREIDNYLMLHFKDTYTTYHNLTCFSLTSYSEVNAIRLMQKEMINKIAASTLHIEDIDKEWVRQLMQTYQTSLSHFVG